MTKYYIVATNEVNNIEWIINDQLEESENLIEFLMQDGYLFDTKEEAQNIINLYHHVYDGECFDLVNLRIFDIEV